MRCCGGPTPVALPSCCNGGPTRGRYTRGYLAPLCGGRKARAMLPTGAPCWLAPALRLVAQPVHPLGVAAAVVPGATMRPGGAGVNPPGQTSPLPGRMWAGHWPPGPTWCALCWHCWCLVRTGHGWPLCGPVCRPVGSGGPWCQVGGCGPCAALWRALVRLWPLARANAPHPPIPIPNTPCIPAWTSTTPPIQIGCHS